MTLQTSTSTTSSSNRPSLTIKPSNWHAGLWEIMLTTAEPVAAVYTAHFMPGNGSENTATGISYPISLKLQNPAVPAAAANESLLLHALPSPGELPSPPSSALSPSGATEFVPHPAVRPVFDLAVQRTIEEFELRHGVGSSLTERGKQIRQKSLALLQTMLKTPVGTMLSIRDEWIVAAGESASSRNPNKIDLAKLTRLRSSNIAAYEFQMHVLNDVLKLKVPVVCGTFSASAMCPGFVFVPLSGSSEHYAKNLPAQLIDTGSEKSIPFGMPVTTKGSSFNNNLENYRLPVLDEIVAMFHARSKDLDDSIF